MGNTGSKYSFKVVLIGDDAVCKTCLVQRFAQDTPGQERYRPMIRDVYRSARAVVLLYDITLQSSFDCLPELLSEIEQCADGKVLKGRKFIKKTNELFPSALGKTADSNGFGYFVEVSALDGTNVDALFQEVATRLTNEMKHCDDNEKIFIYV